MNKFFSISFWVAFLCFLCFIFDIFIFSHVFNVFTPLFSIKEIVAVLLKLFFDFTPLTLYFYRRKIVYKNNFFSAFNITDEFLNRIINKTIIGFCFLLLFFNIIMTSYLINFFLDTKYESVRSSLSSALLKPSEYQDRLR